MCIKKEGDLEQTLEAPHIEDFLFQYQINLLLQILFWLEIGRKPTIGYISYSIMWKFIKQYVMIKCIKCFLQLNKDTVSKRLIIYIAFSIFSIRLITVCAVEKSFWGPNIFMKKFLVISLAFYAKVFLLFYPDLITERWVYS